MPPKSSFLSLGSGLPVTDEQNAQLFNAALQKIELEKTLIQHQPSVFTSKMENGRLLAEEEAKLKRGLLREDSQARIKEMGTTPASLSGGGNKENDADEDKIPQEVRVHSVRFAGLPQEGNVRTFNGKFKPVNLYKLRHLKGHSRFCLNTKEQLYYKNVTQRNVSFLCVGVSIGLLVFLYLSL